MWNGTLLMICATISFLLNYSTSQTCENVSGPYQYSSIEVICTNNTTKIPRFNKTVSNLICLDCNVAILDNTTILINFNGETFNMSNSHIQKIKEGAFNTFTNGTTTFVFENNEIDYIAPKIFNAFTRVQEINLKNCKISSLEAGVFDGIKLLTLDLSANFLSNISYMLEGLSVTTLNLSRNAIEELPEDTFDRIRFWQGRTWKFQELDLSRNFIKKIKPNTFKYSSKEYTIKRLYLGVNSVEVIESNTFSQLSDLQILSLEENKISIMYVDSFKGLTSLRELIINKNLISNIPIGLFEDLGNLQKLDFAENRLTTLSPYSFSGLTSLAKLNISYNDLKIIDSTYLLPVGRLVVLDLSATKLHRLALESILNHHQRLEVVMLNDNFWNCKDLRQMYSLINEHTPGLKNPSRHFEVPNVHGIACSHVKLQSYDNLLFEDFLKVISSDEEYEDNFDYDEVRQDQQISQPNIKSLVSNINYIISMFIILCIIGSIFFIHCIIKCVVQFRKV